MVRSGSEVINGVLYAEEGRFEQRSRLFQFCIDESVFEKADR